MNSDALYKNIGFVAVVVLFLYIVNKVVKLQNKTIEGLNMGSSSSRSKSSSRDDEEEDEEDDGKKKKKKSSRSKDKDDESRLKDLLETLTDIGLDYEDNLNYQANKGLYTQIVNKHLININYNILTVILENVEDIEGNPADAKELLESLNTMKSYASTLEYIRNLIK